MKRLCRRNPNKYYRTIIRVVGYRGNRVRVVIPGYRSRSIDVDKTPFKRFSLKRGDRLVGEVTLGVKPGQLKIKNLKKLSKIV